MGSNHLPLLTIHYCCQRPVLQPCHSCFMRKALLQGPQYGFNEKFSIQYWVSVKNAKLVRHSLCPFFFLSCQIGNSDSESQFDQFQNSGSINKSSYQSSQKSPIFVMNFRESSYQNDIFASLICLSLKRLLQKKSSHFPP